MQKSRDEIAASIRASFGSMMLLVLSVACFVVFLWTVMAFVRFLVGFTL